MADVQLSDGFARIALPLLDALCHTDFAPLERRVFDFIIRMTYGQRIKTDQGEWISLKEAELRLEDIQAGTGLNNKRVCEMLGRLEARNMIRRQGVGRLKVYSIVKDFDLWLGVDELPAKPKRPYQRKNSVNSESKIPQTRNLDTPKIPQTRNVDSENPECRFRESGIFGGDTIDRRYKESIESTAHAPEAPAPHSEKPPTMDDFFNDELQAAKAVAAVIVPKKRTLDDAASDLFDYWQETLMHPRAVFSEEERALAVKRLKELVKGYKGAAAKKGRIMPDAEALDLAEQLCRDAITGIARIPWNVGINKNNKPYDDFSLIFRDQAHIRDYAKAKDERPIDIRTVRRMRQAGFSESGITTGLNMATAMEQIAQWETDHEPR